MTASHSSSDMLNSMRSRRIPAIATTPSIRPQRSTPAPMIFSPPSSVVTLSATATASPPPASISATRASATSLFGSAPPGQRRCRPPPPGTLGCRGQRHRPTDPTTGAGDGHRPCPSGTLTASSLHCLRRRVAGRRPPGLTVGPVGRPGRLTNTRTCSSVPTGSAPHEASQAPSRSGRAQSSTNRPYAAQGMRMHHGRSWILGTGPREPGQAGAGRTRRHRVHRRRAAGPHQPGGPRSARTQPEARGRRGHPPAQRRRDVRALPGRPAGRMVPGADQPPPVGPEVAYILQDSEAKVFVAHERFTDVALDAAEEAELPRPGASPWATSSASARTP